MLAREIKGGTRLTFRGSRELLAMGFSDGPRVGGLFADVASVSDKNFILETREGLHEPYCFAYDIAHHYFVEIDPPHDPVNHPQHYTSHPSGIECIEITRHMGFNLGNAIKYVWRADLKAGVQDLEKAAWYIADEIAKRKKATS